MGLKSGSRDAGLDESDKEVERPTEQEQEVSDVDVEKERTDTSSDESEEVDSESTTESESVSQRPTMDSLPYKLRRDKVNEGREQVPYFLREEIIEGEDELQDTLEEMLGENVYKSDYREAAMVAAQRNPELIAEVLREWGYDLDAV
ncbi:hypothetical protein [Haloprofundus halobius]|uniref:hypothetical protein n=1 Tax=Haloprofundus halobius TaxID=2876194 RepID=UPI001CCE9789|nr:hypothetical protein [Haloprofundus halobius]